MRETSLIINIVVLVVIILLGQEHTHDIYPVTHCHTHSASVLTIGTVLDSTSLEPMHLDSLKRDACWLALSSSPAPQAPGTHQSTLLL